MNLEVCDTCPRPYPWRFKSKVNAICLRVRSSKHYRSRDHTSRGHADRCMCGSWGVSSRGGASAPECGFALGEKLPSQMMPEVLGNQQAQDFSFSIVEKKIVVSFFSHFLKIKIICRLRIGNRQMSRRFLWFLVLINANFFSFCSSKHQYL